MLSPPTNVNFHMRTIAKKSELEIEFQLFSLSLFRLLAELANN